MGGCRWRPFPSAGLLWRFAHPSVIGLHTNGDHNHVVAEEAMKAWLVLCVTAPFLGSAAYAQSGGKPAAQGYIPGQPSNYAQDKQLKALDPPPPTIFDQVHDQYQKQQQKGNVGK
jgi:hypothetical protein